MAIKARIGIDPDLQVSGYCLITHEPFSKATIKQLGCERFFSLINLINLAFEEYGQSLLVCIECGYLNKISNYHAATNKSVASKIGKSVGENHAVSKLLVEYCQRHSIPYKEIKPESSKWNSDLFKKITGWVGRTNSEQRDAVRAAWV